MMLASTVQFSNDNQKPPATSKHQTPGRNPTGMTCHREPEQKNRPHHHLIGMTPIQLPPIRLPPIRLAPAR